MTGRPVERSIQYERDRAEAAEAEVERLTRWLRDWLHDMDGDMQESARALLARSGAPDDHELLCSCEACKAGREALAGPDTPADSPPPMPEACPYCSCLTYRLVNNSLHMDAPDGAVICDNCGKGWVHSVDEHGLIPADSQEDEWFIPEGDRQCGVVHKMARATCMKRRGHEGSHATPQGTWIDGPWCEYPADSQEDKT